MEYTNGAFNRRKRKTTQEEHLGILGPIIRAEVGETIIIVFQNLASRNYSLQANGVSVEKGEEGSKYNDKPEGIALFSSVTCFYKFMVHRLCVASCTE